MEPGGFYVLSHKPFGTLISTLTLISLYCIFSIQVFLLFPITFDSPAFGWIYDPWGPCCEVWLFLGGYKSDIRLNKRTVRVIWILECDVLYSKVGLVLQPMQWSCWGDFFHFCSLHLIRSMLTLTFLISTYLFCDSSAVMQQTWYLSCSTNVSFKMGFCRGTACQRNVNIFLGRGI